jgi:catechol 2,3-dioxygenase-like lactoylglutathione lyase family enzyme
MITGVHTVLYSSDPDATRAFFRDVLGLGSVDAGGGWLIFALPPSELGIHPTEGTIGPELYLMCDDIERSVAEMRARGVEVAREVSDQGWGLVTAVRVPGAGEIGLYQPRHPTALALAVEQAQRSL